VAPFQVPLRLLSVDLGKELELETVDLSFVVGAIKAEDVVLQVDLLLL